MIDEKKIEKTAEEYAENSGFITKDCYEVGFKAGINWFLDNLWHDASERMEFDRKILLEFVDKSYVFVKLRGENDRIHLPFKDKVTRWLYIDDLLKGGK